MAAWSLPASNLQLRDGSPAVDAGATDTGVTTDFVGAGRPFGEAPDLGALEYGASAGGGGGTGAEGGAGASSGDGGSGAVGASSAGGAGASSNAAPPNDAQQNDGCGCRHTGRVRGRGGSFALVGIVLALSSAAQRSSLRGGFLGLVGTADEGLGCSSRIGDDS